MNPSSAGHMSLYIICADFLPVRDGMTLARHFSAGSEGRHGRSPVGTIEFISQHILPLIQCCIS
jgi:hypothetical protein